MLENYETVAERLARWLDAHPEGQILTEMLTPPGQDCCVFKATLMLAGVMVANGHAEEIRGQGNVNRTSHVENCETSAIGRALANAGVAGSDPSRRASREEMQKVERYSTSNGHSNTKVTMVTGTGGASEKQIGYIRGAAKRDGHPAPIGLDGWTKQEASSWIEAHKNGRNAGDIPNPLQANDEEPF